MTSPHLNQLSVLDLVSQAGPVAKVVLLLLLVASIVCWAIIFAKWKTLRLAQRQNEKFIHAFWNGKSIDEIVAKSEHYPHSPVASVFNSGVKELRKLSQPDNTIYNPAPSTTPHFGPTTPEKIENIYRALIRTSTTEISKLERRVGVLATTASAAPFVGLFGTVWGIMNSFQTIGATGTANLAAVAPGISEALITTATGIGAAIPAVVAYNFFAGEIKKIAADMECFSQDFINIVQRSYIHSKKGS